MKASLRCLLSLSLLLFLFHRDGVEAICPSNPPPPSPVPLYFGFMTAVDPQSDYVLAGIIPAVDLALELINNNTNILPGYRLTYNGTIYDSKVRKKQLMILYNFLMCKFILAVKKLVFAFMCVHIALQVTNS